jgi:putative hemolysin
VHREDGGVLVVPGRYPMHDLVDIGVELDEGNDATVAGFVLHAAGRFPGVGDTIDADGWRIEVRRIEDHAITELALTPVGQPNEAVEVAPN